MGSLGVYWGDVRLFWVKCKAFLGKVPKPEVSLDLIKFQG